MQPRILTSTLHDNNGDLKLAGFILIFLFLPIFLAAGNIIEISAQNNSINLGDKLSCAEAVHNELSENQALHLLFKPCSKRLFFSGWHNTRKCFWLKFEYRCMGNIETPLMLELDNALIAEVKYYALLNDSVIDFNVAGDNYPFANRPLKSRNLIYQLPNQKGNTYTILFQMYNDGRSFHAPLVIKSANQFYNDLYLKQLIYGIFFGILSLIVLYNFTLFFLINERIYLWFALFVASFGLMQLVFSGYAFQYFFPNNPWFADKFGSISTALSSILALQFTTHFFNKNLGYAWMPVLVRGWQIILFTAGVFSLFSGWFSFFAIGSLYYLFTFTYVIILVISAKHAFSKQINYARFYMSAIILFIISAISINIYSEGDLIEENIFTNNSILTGIVLIFAALSVSIFDRLLLIKKQKEKAQAQSINSLEELNHLRAQHNLILEQKVAEKTAALIDKQNQLNIAIINGEELERKRFSQELHDGLGSMLSTIKLNLSASQQKNRSEEMERTISLIDKACDEVRAISHNLTPPMFEKFGLMRSLDDLIVRLNETSHLTCHFEADEITTQFNLTVQLSIYRMVSELINNVVKHANAGKLYLQIFTHENTLNIILEDDGIGIKQQDAVSGIGLNNIRSRLSSISGSMNIDSVEGQGTTIIIQIPTFSRVLT